MRNFFRVVLLVKSLIAIGGFGWAVGMIFSAPETTVRAEAPATLQNAAFAVEPSRPEQQWRIAP